MLVTIPTETLAYIIAKAREFDAETPPVDEESGSNATDDDSRDVLEDTPDNPTRQELAGAIDSLSDAQRVELLALVWVGRGDFAAAEWRTALRQARELHDERLTEYLIETPLLGDYLAEAAAQLGAAVETA